jgi:hypothetical protein
MIRHILAQEATTVNWRECIDSGSIVLIKLSPQFEEASTLIGSIIIGQLLLAAFSRADTPEGERRPFHLYCDEFQRFATGYFNIIISNSRKFILDLFSPTKRLSSWIGLTGLRSRVPVCSLRFG